MMQALVLDRYGSPDDLSVREVPRPDPGDGEVLVRVHASSVNDWDWCLTRGSPLYIRAFCGLRRPTVSVPGVDVAGVVERVGEGVTAFAPGDRVFGDLSGCGFGAFAEWAAAPASALRAMPGGMGFEEAAALPHAATLAWQALTALAGVGEGDRLLVNGAGGGVGTIAAAIARHLGVASLAGVDAVEKHDAMRLVGYDEVIDYRRVDFTRRGERSTVILDTRSDRGLGAYRQALEPGGRYATVGGRTGRLLQIGLLGGVYGRVVSRRFGLLALKPNGGLDEIVALCERGVASPVIDRVFPFDGTPAAIRRFGEGRHVGKIVIRVGEPRA